MSTARKSYTALLWAAGLFAIALALRLQGLADESPWGDEVLTAGRYPVDSLRAFLRDAFSVDPTIRHAPLYHIAQYGWTRFAGDSVVSLRALSVLLSLVALGQAALLCRAVTGGPGWVGAMALIALSPMQIYFAQEIRVYALANVFALAAMHLCLRFRQRGGPARLALLAAANGALILTHSLGGLLLLPQACYLLLTVKLSRSTLQWAGVHAALVLLYFGWLLGLGYDIDRESIAYNDRLAGFREVAVALAQFAGGRFSGDNPGAWLAGGVNLEGLLAIALLALMLTVGRSSRRSANPAQREGLLLLVLWFVLPLAALYLVGRFWKPFFYTRYVLHCAFPVAILAGWAISVAGRRWWGVALSALLLACAAWQSLALPRPFRADYGALARAVAADASPGKYVIALKPFNHRAAEFALRDQGVPVEKLHGFKEMVGVARNRATSGETVWAVFYRWDDTTDFARQLGMAGLEVDPLDTAGMPPLMVFRVRAVLQPSSGI